MKNVKQRLFRPSLAFTAFMGGFLLLLGTEQLAFLYQFDFLEATSKGDFSGFENSELTAGQWYLRMMIFRGWIELLTTFIVFLITLALCKKLREHWLNALTVLILCLVGKYTFLLDISTVSPIVQSPGLLFESLGLWYVIVVNGMFYSLLAVATFALIWRKFRPMSVADSNL